MTFNRDGICRHCLEYERSKPHGEERFLRRIRSKPGNKYDGVIGISGGRDSCYVAYLIKKRFNMNVLAVFYESPFYCNLARRNAKSVCDTLGIELLTVTSKNNLEYHLLRNHLISLAPTGTTWGQCMFCHYGIDAVLFHVARENGIPFILSGVTKHELWNPGSRMGFLAARIKRLPKTEWFHCLFHQAKAYHCLVEQRRQFPIPGNNKLTVYRGTNTPKDGPENLRVFDYIQWDFREIEKALTEEVGWVKPDSDLSWRYDCSLEPLLDWTYKKEFGISTVGIYLSGLIRSSQIDRDEAMSITEACEDYDTLCQKAASVFNFLKIPTRIQDKFFTAV